MLLLHFFHQHNLSQKESRNITLVVILKILILNSKYTRIKLLESKLCTAVVMLCRDNCVITTLIILFSSYMTDLV
jgi:hypothetical protein